MNGISVLSGGERERLEEDRDKLSPNAKSKIATIEAEMALVKFELNNLRPKISAFKRAHTFHEFDEGKWVWKTVFELVELRQFDAAPGIEANAAELGGKILGLKREIVNIVVKAIPMSRKETLAGID